MSSWKLWIDDHKLVCALLALILLAALLCGYFFYGRPALLRTKYKLAYEAEILAVVDGQIVGTAGIEKVGKHEKLSHRCDFGVSVDKEFWGLGIGSALLDACIECAKKAGYKQMELEVVAENDRAVKMYEKAGFVEYGRNPRDFLSRYSGYQELVYMRLELD